MVICCQSQEASRGPSATAELLVPSVYYNNVAFHNADRLYDMPTKLKLIRNGIMDLKILGEMRLRQTDICAPRNSC